jgi:hypothetical protein
LAVSGPLGAARIDALARGDFSLSDRNEVDYLGSGRGNDTDVSLCGVDALPAAEIGEPTPVDGRVLTPGRRCAHTEERADDE